MSAAASRSIPSDPEPQPNSRKRQRRRQPANSSDSVIEEQAAMVAHLHFLRQDLELRTRRKKRTGFLQFLDEILGPRSSSKGR